MILHKVGFNNEKFMWWRCRDLSLRKIKSAKTFVQLALSI